MACTDHPEPITYSSKWVANYCPKNTMERISKLFTHSNRLIIFKQDNIQNYSTEIFSTTNASLDEIATLAEQHKGTSILFSFSNPD